MLKEALRLVETIQDPELRQKVKEFLKDPPSSLDAPSLPLEVCPGGAFQHHSYPGGLMEHTLSVTKIALSLCDVLDSYSDAEVNRDHVIAGALIHDLMKVYCYTENEDGGFRTSDYGVIVDHLTLMVTEAMKRNLPLEVVHIVASHHGEVSPVRPRTVEALVVSLADKTDSELNNKILRAAETLLRRKGVNRPRMMSAEEALGVVKENSQSRFESLGR